MDKTLYHSFQGHRCGHRGIRAARKDEIRHRCDCVIHGFSSLTLFWQQTSSPSCGDALLTQVWPVTVTFALIWLLASTGYESHSPSYSAVRLSRRQGEKLFLPIGFVKQEVPVNHAVPWGQGKQNQNMNKQMQAEGTRYSPGSPPLLLQLHEYSQCLSHQWELVILFLVNL